MRNKVTGAIVYVRTEPYAITGRPPKGRQRTLFLSCGHSETNPVSTPVPLTVDCHDCRHEGKGINCASCGTSVLFPN